MVATDHCVFCGEEITPPESAVEQRRLQLDGESAVVDRYHPECFRKLFGREPDTE